MQRASRRFLLEILESRDLPSTVDLTLLPVGGDYRVFQDGGALTLVHNGSDVLYDQPIDTTTPLTVNVHGSTVAETIALDVGSFAALGSNVAFTIDGGGGADSATLDGPATGTNALIGPSSGTVIGSFYRVDLTTVPTIRVNATGTGGSATLEGSAGDDIYTGTPGGDVTLRSKGVFQNTVTGFAQVVADGGGGNDTAYHTDTAGNDIGISTANYSRLSTADGAFSAETRGFETTSFASTQGGQDQMWLYDGAGDDQAVLSGSYVRLTAAAGDRVSEATGFAKTQVLSVNGGHDQASIMDTAGSDTAVVTASFAYLTPPAGGPVPIAIGFDDVRVVSTAGNDTAWLYDTAGNDQASLAPGLSKLVSGNGQTDTAVSFAHVYAVANQGGNDTATIQDTTGNDHAVLTDHFAQLQPSSGVPSLMVYGFETTEVDSTVGTDQAWLYDSPGDDTAVSTATTASITTAGGTVYRAVGFAQATLISRNGGTDTAWLYDTAGNDTAVATPNFAYIQGPHGPLPTAYGFAKVYLNSTNGGNDTAWLYDGPGDDTATAAPGYATVTAGAKSYQEAGFQSVTLDASSGGGQDKLYLYDSTGNDTLTFSGASNYGTLTDAAGSYAINFFRYEKVIAYANQSSADVDRAFLYDAPGTDIFFGPDTPEPLGTFTNEAQTFYLQVYAFNAVSLYGSPNERNVLNVLPIFPPTFTIQATNFITLDQYYYGLYDDSGPYTPYAMIYSPDYGGPLTYDQSLQKLKQAVLQRDPSFAQITDRFQLALQLRNFVHQNVWSGTNSRFVARPLDPYNYYLAVLVHHYERVECGGITIMFMDILRAFGYQTRMIDLFAKDPVEGGHTTSEILLNGHWIAMDATFNCIFVNAQGVCLDYAAMYNGTPFTITRSGFSAQPLMQFETYPVPYSHYLYKMVYDPF